MSGVYLIEFLQFTMPKACAGLTRKTFRLVSGLRLSFVYLIRQWPGPLGLAGICLLVVLSIITPLAERASANPNLPDDLSYNTQTTWILPGLPHLSDTSAYIPHNFSHGEAVFTLEDEVIHGFRPGKLYLEMYVRDIAWGMEAAQYYYPDEYLREPIEAFLRRQYTDQTASLDGDFGVLAGSGAIGGIITPEGHSNKQTITSDEETSLIHAAYLYYTITQDDAWLGSTIADLPVIERLNLAADWLYSHRFDTDSGLFWRGHTVDWGDVKFEESTNYTDYDPAGDHLTASIYDQALAYLALTELAELNAVVGHTARADEWRDKARSLKEATNARLWQPDKGFYRTHLHITPLEHDFDEAAMVSISNALAIYAGLTDFDQSQAILRNLERVRLESDADKPGLSIYPYYPNKWPDLFFDYLGMGYGNYQNGGVWDWWGGVQIKTEFLEGFAGEATEHLLQVANDWHQHPGNIIEWQSTTDPEHHEGSHYYSAAAGTMGSAIIQGFFGIELSGQGLILQPRLGLTDGYIRVYQPATDRYAAYRYDWDQDVIRIDYGTNTAEPVVIKILTLRPEEVLTVTFDSQPVDFNIETVGNDSYVVLSGPSGQHGLEMVMGSPTTEPASSDISKDTASPATSVIPNPGPAVDAVGPSRPSTLANPENNPPARQVEGPQASQTAPPDPGIPIDEDWQSQLRLIQYAGTGLVVLSALGLIALLTLRSRQR